MVMISLCISYFVLYWNNGKKGVVIIKMKEENRITVEKVIASVDEVLSQLWHTPWAFRLEEDGTLVADRRCMHQTENDEESQEEYEQVEQYRRSVWEEYEELFFLSPFSYNRCEKVKEFDWLDVAIMSWEEIIDNFLREELRLVRAILRSKEYGHEPVPEELSEEALDMLIAFRYKERLAAAMEWEVMEAAYREEVMELKEQIAELKKQVEESKGKR